MGLTRDERAALIAQYEAGPAVLRAAFDRLPVEARTWRPAPGEWSAHEIIIHCADSETNAHGRIRYLIAEPDPLIVGYDQERWADLFAYLDSPLEPAFATVDAVRANTTALIRSFPEDAWSNAGRHTESGQFSAEDWLRIYGVHLHEHADQIDENFAAWRRRDT